MNDVTRSGVGDRPVERRGPSRNVAVTVPDADGKPAYELKRGPEGVTIRQASFRMSNPKVSVDDLRTAVAMLGDVPDG